MILNWLINTASKDTAGLRDSPGGKDGRPSAEPVLRGLQPQLSPDADYSGPYGCCCLVASAGNAHR